MRLCAGSGISGLAAMPLVTLNTGMPLIRPFLALDKDRLIATLQADGLRWLEDPSNQSTCFERVRLRSAFAALAEEGLDTHRLRKLAARAKRADIALAHATETAFAHYHIPDKSDRVRFAPGLFREPEEIILRIILRALDRMTPEKETPLEKAENLLARLVAGRSLRQRSCAKAQRGAKAQAGPASPGAGGRPSSAAGMRASDKRGMDANKPWA
jgi:tRNA(Ile)-lysidine synthase